MTRSCVPGALLGLWVAIGLVVPSAAQAYAAPLVRVLFVGRAWTAWGNAQGSQGDIYFLVRN